MGHAIVSGVIGVAIGCGFTFLASLNNPPPWTLSQAMTAVAMASFFGPFGTALGCMRRIQSMKAGSAAS